LVKIFNKKFNNPLKKDSSFAIISNTKIQDDKRLEQAKALLLKQNNEEEFKDLDGDEALNQNYDEDEDEEFERDEDLSRTETIDPIEKKRRRLDSLRQIYAELEREEAEENLKIKIHKKKQSIAQKREKMEEIIAEQREKDKFYEEPQNEEGYWILKEEKWNREYEDLMISLAKATNDEQRKPIQKELKRLENIKKKNKAKNTMNKITRGINKTTQKIGSVSRGIGKFADEIGQMGNQMGAVGSENHRKKASTMINPKKNEFAGFEDFFKDKKGSSGGDKINFDDFFRDKPKPTKKTTTRKTTKKKATKKKATKKKKKVAKKKKKTTKKKTTKKATTKKSTTPNWENFFK
jgi:hypothetical protein